MLKLKRFTLFAVLFFGCMAYTFAQNVAFSEDFESINTPGGVGTLPTGWTTYIEDSNTLNSQVNFFTDAWNVVNFSDIGKTMATASYFTDPAAQADRWAVTPQITIPTTNPTLFFDDLSGATDNGGDHIQIFVSTTGNTPADFTGSPVFEEDVPFDGSFHSRSVSLSAFAGQDVYIAFRSTGIDGYILAVDNIQIRSVLDTDLALTSIDMNTNVAPGDNAIKGTVTNMGGNDVTSFDVTWSVDGGADHTETVSGVNISTLGTYSFTLNDPWNAQPVTGSHYIYINLSNVNGGTNDGDLTNNDDAKDIVVASGSAPKRVLYEEFTSSFCGPCGSWNSISFTPFFDQLNSEGYGDNYSLVKYQFWIPDADPYFTNEGWERGQYYSINADPTMLREGVPETYEGAVYLSDIPPVMHDHFVQTLSEPAFFNMGVTATFNNQNVDVTVNTTPYISGTYTLYVAVVEKMTTGNTGTNGETQFEQVMMKMLPDAQGTSVTYVDGQDDTQTFSVDLSQESITSDYSVGQSGPTGGSQMAPHVEDFNDLQVIAWIQNDATHQVMQSNVSNQGMGVNDHSDELSKLSIYPNPSNGTLHIATENPVNLIITNMMGAQVFAQNNVDSATQLNIGDLASGVYFVTINQKDNTVTKKLIVK